MTTGKENDALLGSKESDTIQILKENDTKGKKIKRYEGSKWQDKERKWQDAEKVKKGKENDTYGSKGTKKGK